jgi:hypothetical protein
MNQLTLRELMNEDYERNNNDFVYEYILKYKLKTYKRVKGCMRDLTTEDMVKKIYSYETKRNIEDGFLHTKIDRLERFMGKKCFVGPDKIVFIYT